MDIYAQNIMDHYRKPHHFGEPSDFDCKFNETNASCGDDITVFLKFDGDVISSIDFVGNGCAISQSAISMLTDLFVGKTSNFVLSCDFEYMKNILGVEISERRYKCSMIGLIAIKEAIKMRK